MKALILEENGKLVCKEDHPVPAPGEGEALVRMRAVGLCSSDLPRAFAGGSYRYPHILGHEMFGELPDGKQVAVFPLIPCGTCEQCVAGAVNCCLSYDYLGSRRDGGCAEYVAAPKDNCIAAPVGLDPIFGALTEPTAVCIHAAELVDYADRRVLIIGDGAMSAIIARYLISRGTDVTVLGKHEEKLSCASALGAKTVTIESAVAPSSYDVVFELAGTDSAYALAIASARPHGDIVFVGNIRADLSLPKQIFSTILRKELHIRGSWNSLPSEWNDAMQFLVATPEIRSLISYIVPLAALPQTLDAAHRGVLPGFMKLVARIA